MTLLHQICDIRATTICCYRLATKAKTAEVPPWRKYITLRPIAAPVRHPGDAPRQKTGGFPPAAARLAELGDPVRQPRNLPAHRFLVDDAFPWPRASAPARPPPGPPARPSCRRWRWHPRPRAAKVRMRERRALLTSVRRAILRVAFLADLVLAIGFRDFAGGGKTSGGVKRRRVGDAYSDAAGGRQRAPRARSMVGRRAGPRMRRRRPDQATRFARTCRSRRPRRRGRRRKTARAAASPVAQAGSPWMWPSSDLTPGTSGRPSNSLRIVTAASSAAASP